MPAAVMLRIAHARAGARFAHNQEAKRIEVDVGGERLGISIAEDYTRTETVLVDSKHSWMKTRTYTYHFTSYLRLTISGDFAGRKSWADGKRSRLEEKIESIVAGLVSGFENFALWNTIPNLSTKRVDGTHLTLIEPPHVDKIAKEMLSWFA